MDLFQLLSFPLNAQVHDSFLLLISAIKSRWQSLQSDDLRRGDGEEYETFSATFGGTAAVISALKKNKLESPLSIRRREEKRLPASVRAGERDAGGISAGRRKKGHLALVSTKQRTDVIKETGVIKARAAAVFREELCIL